jgi:hypothetical protein
LLVAITSRTDQFELTPGGLVEVACWSAASVDRDSSLLEVSAHDKENEDTTNV